MKSILGYITVGMILAGSALTVTAAPKPAPKGGLSLDEIEQMIRRGELDDASAALDSAAVAQPKNARIDYLRGQCFVAGNDDDNAVAAFESANKKGSNDALLQLAEIALRQYRVDDAEDNIYAYKAYIAKNKSKKLPDNSDEVASRLTRARSMLERVEKIVVFDSINIDKDYFLDAYKMSAEAGKLSTPDILPDGVAYTEPTVVYSTEDGREMIWGAQTDDNIFRLLTMHRLTDGSWELPESVGDHLGQGYDANYPFLMPDGVTLYFASDNEESLGGLDIFVSRNNGTEFLQAQNVGLPYNSPYDDYMLAIDELTGVGFWASDRNRLGDKVTVYFFIPSASRVNVDLDDPMLAQRASLHSIADTWPADADFSAQHKALANIAASEKNSVRQFEFALPDGRVLTRYDQFQSPVATDLMGQYVDLEKSTEASRQRLDKLRLAYSGGDTATASEILQLEKEVADSGRRLKRLANDIIRAEMGGNLK